MGWGVGGGGLECEGWVGVVGGWIVVGGGGGVVLAVVRGNLVVAGVSWVGCALVLPLSGVALGVVPHTVGAWTKLLGFKPLRWNFPGPGR